MGSRRSAVRVPLVRVRGLPPGSRAKEGTVRLEPPGVACEGCLEDFESLDLDATPEALFLYRNAEDVFSLQR